MHQAPDTRLFSSALIFQDVDAETLAREDVTQRSIRAGLTTPGTWHAYLRKMLPPVSQRPDPSSYQT